VRRIVYSIGEGLLVIALFTAALSAQKAMFAGPAEAAGVAPLLVQLEGSNVSLLKMAEPKRQDFSHLGLYTTGSKSRD